jgi:hypothetical protein
MRNQVKIMERRNFLKTMFGVAAGMALPGVVYASTPTSQVSASDNRTLDLLKTAGNASGGALNPLAQATYTPLLNSEFHIHSGELTIPVQLVSVAGANPKLKVPRSVAQEQFSLLFRAPGDSNLSQEMHTLSHPTLGTFSLFLVPVGTQAHDMHYEAIIHS